MSTHPTESSSPQESPNSAPLGSKYHRKGPKTLLLAMTVIIFSAGLLLAITNYRAVILQLTRPSQRLEHIWLWDLERLSVDKKLPREWNHLRSVKIIPADNESTKLLAQIKVPPISADPQRGQNDLEVRVFHWTEGTDFGVILQYELFTVEGKNKIWELGRTFQLGKLSEEKKITTTVVK